MKHWYQSTLLLVVALLGVSTAALTGVVVVSHQGLERLSLEEDREFALAVDLIEDAYRLKVAFERQVVGVRGYVATGEIAMLAARDEGAREFAQVLARMRSLRQLPPSRVLLGEVATLEAAHREHVQRVIALKRAGRVPEAQALLVHDVAPLKAQFLTRVDALIAEQRGEVGGLHAHVNDVEGEVKGLLNLWALLSVPLFLALAASIAWRLLLPLRALAAASRRMAAGRYNVRVPIYYQDEFGEVAQAFNTMAEHVAETLASLEARNQELRRIDRYRDEFLSTVTHELKTPLTAILGFARMLERGSKGPLSDPQRQSVGKIVKQTHKLLQLINDLLDSSAIRLGKLALAPAPTPYAPLVADALALMAPLAEQKHQALLLEEVPAVRPMLDAGRASQVLLNLVGNAIKYTPEHGAIKVRARLEGERLVTEVLDTGPGIAPEDLPGLFEPFKRLEAARDTAGTGLGLTISQAIVEAHGGELGVETALGAGSRFWFSLPLTTEKADA